MKKRFYLIAALAVIGLIAVAATQVTTYYSLYIKYHRTSPWLIKLLDSGGSEAMYTSIAGNTELKNLTVTAGVTVSGGTISLTGINTLSQDAVVIGTSSVLSTWSGAAAGQSYYATAPGKRYIVDVQAIKESGMSGSFSGVTLMLPNAATYSEYTVTVEYAVTGASGWAALDGSTAGTTTVFIYPYSAGTTQYYNGPAAYQAQTLLNCGQTLSGTTLYNLSRNMAAGASFWMLDKPGESVTYALYNSQVSAYPVKWLLVN